MGHVAPCSGCRRAVHSAKFRKRFWRGCFHKDRTILRNAPLGEVWVGLLAKLAGHANAAITLSHYTQALRGGKAAMQTLEEAFTSGRD